MEKKVAYQNYLTLIESLQTLAAEYNTQKNSFPSFVCLADELALTFDDRFYSVDEYVKYSFIDSEQMAKLQIINSELERMTREKTLWANEALRKNEDWKNIRILAKQALNALNVEQRPPDLSWITYIKGDN
jgi:hypothetical protein